MTEKRKQTEGPVNATDVLSQLVEYLYAMGLRTLLAALLVALVVYFAAQSEAVTGGMDIWLAAVFVVTSLRLLLVWFRQRSQQAYSPRVWAQAYAVGALASGVLWGTLILFVDPAQSIYFQLFLLVVLSGMPIAAMPADSTYPPVYYAFSIPIVTALLYWALFIMVHLNLHFVFVLIAYVIILGVTAVTYHQNMRLTIETRLQNDELIQRLSGANRQLEEMAYLDPLTGLSNRRWFQMQTEKDLDQGLNSGRRLALMLIDLDNFKQVNDTLGHDAGDALLLCIARRLKESLQLFCEQSGKLGRAARFGGDEFTILLDNMDGRTGLALTARGILDRLNQPVMLDGTEWEPSASIGIALFPEHANHFSALMRSADIAMYLAKKEGRNQYRFFSPDLA